MEHNNPDTPRGYGRGRPMDRNDLRRPIGYTYATDTDYVPTEGSSNGLRITSPGGDTAWRDDAHKVEPGILPVPAGDQAHPPCVVNVCSGVNTPPPADKETRKSTLSPFAKEFVPRNFHPEPRVPPTQIPEDVTIDTSADSYPIQELRQFLYEITLSPGKFERKIQPLTDTMNAMVDDDDTMRSIVNIIFDESVRQPNFRYSGARLCKSLCNELTVSSDRLNFRCLLLQRCSLEHKRREKIAQANDGGTYLRGFAMFLAELFSQLEISSQRIAILGESLPSVVETLLSYPSPDNLKSICQILKLVGVYLEDFERSKIPNNGAAPEMDKIISSLEDVAMSREYSSDITSMARNVAQLRACDWGRAVTPSAHSDPVPDDSALPISSFASDEPVLYGPDGKPLTPEESLFLHSQYGCQVPDPDEYEYDDDNAYNEMEEEIEEAYELFLREHETSR